jgi:hypothetical protein
MSVRIRTRRANGQESEELYAQETEGLRALHRNLDTHRRLGHNISRNDAGTLFTVTDQKGTLVQESEIIRSS